MREHPGSEALRARSPELLHELLVSDLLDGEQEWLEDPRDLMVALAPYHDCAQRLGLDPAIAFREAAESGPESLREFVTEFGERRDVTPSAFGYVVAEGPTGPSYQRTDSPSADEIRELLEWLGED
jgi:hypothetical protein